MTGDPTDQYNRFTSDCWKHSQYEIGHHSFGELDMIGPRKQIKLPLIKPDVSCHECIEFLQKNLNRN